MIKQSFYLLFKKRQISFRYQSYNFELKQRIIKMGQACCQVTVDDGQFEMKVISIKQTDYEPAIDFDKNNPLLKEKYHNLDQLPVFKYKSQNKFFIGQWKNGSADGPGTLYVPDHLLYHGNFTDSVPQGHGQMNFLNKDQQYKGNFHNGKADGEGLYKNNVKKFTFEGTWRNSKPQKGTLIFEENPNIVKIYIKDFGSGQAHISYKDGRQYEGQIDQVNFVPEGKGELTFIDGSKFSGSWKNGAMHGQGLYQWKDGSKYEGDYLNGKKQGKGTFYYTSGKKYVGQWVNGKQEGAGKIVTKDGQIQKQGMWKNGSYQKPFEAPVSQQQQPQQDN